ncbi:MAG: hypothetical protein K2Q18_15030 [Bdellovibrionales bacterium]|nr:hypothetical protein [Bdellovibrionales bacterium]
MMKKEKHPNTDPKTTLCTYIVIGPMPFPWKAFKRHLKDPKKYSKIKLFFVDGGHVHFEKLKKEAPFLIESAVTVGDGDSTKVPMILKKKDQNLSDLAFFLGEMLKVKGIGSLYFLGFLGGRLDHELFNLGEIARFVEKTPAKSTPKITLNDTVEFLNSGTHLLDIDTLFSLASFTPNKIKIQGRCLYKLLKWTPLPVLSSLGLSNFGSGPVKIETKRPLAVILG